MIKLPRYYLVIASLVLVGGFLGPCAVFIGIKFEFLNTIDNSYQLIVALLLMLVVGFIAAVPVSAMIIIFGARRFDPYYCGVYFKRSIWSVPYHINYSLIKKISLKNKSDQRSDGWVVELSNMKFLLLGDSKTKLENDVRVLPELLEHLAKHFQFDKDALLEEVNQRMTADPFKPWSITVWEKQD